MPAEEAWWASSPLAGRMIFAVGARRSGTFWLQRMLTAHPEIDAVPSETHLMAAGISPLLARFHHGVKSSPQVGTLYAERTDLNQAVRRLCDAVFVPFLGPGSALLSERTPVHAQHLGTIARIYPDARIIHIIRDGRDVARSITTQAWGAADVAEAAREWRDTITAARVHGPADGYLEVRYEKLRADPEQQLAAMFRWLGVDASPQALEGPLEAYGVKRNLAPRRSDPASGSWRDEWTRRDLVKFERAGGALLRDLGYPPAPTREPSTLRGAVQAVRRRAGRIRSAYARARGARFVDSRVHFRVGQESVDQLIGALRYNPDDARSMLPSNFVLDVDGARVSGSEAADKLVALAQADVALRGRQVAGEAVPGDPEFTVRMQLEGPGGSHVGRELKISLNDGKVVAVRVPAADDR